jgi:hypothetical protein
MVCGFGIGFGASPAGAQEAAPLGGGTALREHHPDVFRMFERMERAHGVLLHDLAIEGQTVRDNGDELPTFGFEFDMVDRLTFLMQGEGPPEEAEVARAGYDALGERAAGIIRWGHAFQRETLSVLADPAVDDRAAALADLVARYQARADLALPSVPKDMDILYDHTYAFGFRSGYADLDGFIWAGHWYRLAATEPFTDLPPGPDRLAGLDTIQARYFSKLSYGEPPAFFPSEIPLAPAISPGLIWESPETAMIWDNLSMFLEVLSDVLASPHTPDVEGAIEATTNFFMDPGLAVTDQDEWEIMALRHGIFYQGGYPLAVMLESERNVGGHAAHFQESGVTLTIPGMPRR